MSVLIRRADASDAAIVALLGRLTFRETFSALFAQHEDDLRAYLDHTFAPAKIAASIGKAENLYWIASVDGLPVGYGKLKFPSACESVDAATPAQLQKIYVLAEYIAHKLGSALMDDMLAEAGQLGADAIWLNVVTSNARAIGFYQRQGWTHAGDVVFAIGSQSFDFLTLGKALPG